MREEFDIYEVESTFDFKGFLYKLLANWPLFLLAFVIAMGVAHYINVRKLPVYTMTNLISIKDDQNPFFTTTTSLTFNWGGTTDKVNTAIITLKSRSHNEKVVARMQSYLDYVKQGEYQLIDVYKQTPFRVDVTKDAPQILSTPLKVRFQDSVTFTLEKTFVDGNISTFNYETKSSRSEYRQAETFKKSFKIGAHISLPFFSGTFLPNPQIKVVPGDEFFISFSDFDATVKENQIIIQPDSKGSSVFTMRKNGLNKAKLVDYLNTSVAVLSENMLERKNLFATKTIAFINNSLEEKSTELKNVEKELNTFRNKTNVYDLNEAGIEIKEKLNILDTQKQETNRKLNYYKTLEVYLNKRIDYRDVPAPSVAGITEPSISEGVSKMVSLAEQRNNLQYSFKEGAPVFADIDRRINSIKRVLLENINSSMGLILQELSQFNTDIASYDYQIKKLPKEQQELLKIERKYNLNQGVYDLFLAKLSEANLVKAANVSDVLVIDTAKDTGGGKIGPNTQVNYMMALLFGFLFPFLFVFIKAFFNNKISSVKEIERLSKVPVLGVVGKSSVKNNLAVLTKPKSAIAESFRAIRSSLQFIYKKQGLEGTKTVLVTSSVSGEGKTFCSINIASVFALSQKKTILLGLDLRKPKIFNDFNIKNDIGVVNYLIRDTDLDGVIQKTHIENLDIITSGVIPPNPSELLMSDQMEVLISALKERYDYIVLDSPPLGLVADSLELIKFADATIYMVRQNYTKKGMLSLINEKYKKGEVKNISFVLNFFEDMGSYSYGYGSYGNGYHEDEETLSFSQRILSLFKKE